MGRVWDWLMKSESLEARAEAQGGWNFLADMLRSNQAPTYAGVPVTQENASNLPAVFRCWDLNASTVETLPVNCLIKRGDKRMSYPDPFWLTQPNDEQDWGQFISQGQLSLEADGNAFIMKASTDGGRLVGLYVLAPTSVTVERVKLGNKPAVVYKVHTDDGEVVFPATAVIHVRWLTPPGHLRGLSPIAAAAQTIGTGLAAERFGAQFFGSGATLSGVIQGPPTWNPGPEVTERLKADFTRKHGGISKSHAIGVLTGGATWVPLSVNPEESQFLQTRQFTDTQVANIHGVPPEYVTSTEGAKGYVTGLFARQYMWLQTGINPRLTRWERAFSPLLPTGVYIKFNRNAFLQMDPTERAAFYAAGLRDRWLTPNEVRTKEDMNSLSNGDEPLESVQWRGSLPDRVEAVGSLVRAGFEPAAALDLFGIQKMPYLEVQPVTLRPLNEDGTQLAPAASDEVPGEKSRAKNIRRSR